MFRSRKSSAHKHVLANTAEIRRSQLLLDNSEETGVLEKKKSLRIQLTPPVQPATSVKIRSDEDLEKYLQICCTQPPLAEGHVCKEISRFRTFDRFRKRYFVLYNGLLLYYSHKSKYDRDKKNGLKHSKRIVLEDVYLTKPESPPSNARFSFYLHTPHKMNKREKVLIVVQSRQARHLWTDKLQAQNTQLVSPIHLSMKSFSISMITKS